VRTINVKQLGHAIYHIDAYDEDHLITLPSLHIEGLVYGSPYVELNTHTYIKSSSGYTSKIIYSGKGWMSGKKNSFTATLYPDGKEKDILYSVEGQWNNSFIARDAKSKIEIETYSPKSSQTTPLIVAPLDQQDDLESRRAWHAVAEAIERGDMDVTSTEKGKIENAQRELRKKEREEGREWERRYFSRVDPDERFERLAESVGYQLEADKTGGMWRWDGTKYESHLKKSTPQAENKMST
jgi:oxysterol-binding protein-related protein 9/10/11